MIISVYASVTLFRHISCSRLLSVMWLFLLKFSGLSSVVEYLVVYVGTPYYRTRHISAQGMIRVGSNLGIFAGTSLNSMILIGANILW